MKSLAELNLQPPSNSNLGPLDWVLSTLTTRPLLHVKFKLHGSGKKNQLMFFDFASTQILKLKAQTSVLDLALIYRCCPLAL